MAEGKWITGLTADMPLLDAARVVMPTRFEAVVLLLPNAVHLAADDPEHVHHLRVATRRAAAAQRLFADCLHRKHQKALKARLHSIRRAAGSARDCDVFSQMLAATPMLRSAAAKSTRDLLYGTEAARRLDAQSQLIATADDDGAKLQKEIDKLGDPSAWRSEDGQTVGAMAAKRFTALIETLNEAATPLPATYEELHRLRIVGKRLRYSIEVFAECFKAPLRDQLYPVLVEMQESLGAITDAHVAAQRLMDIRDHLKSFQPAAWPRFRAYVEGLLRSQRRVLPRERKAFQRWVTQWRRLSSELPIRLAE